MERMIWKRSMTASVAAMVALFWGTTSFVDEVKGYEMIVVKTGRSRPQDDLAAHQRRAGPNNSREDV